MAIRYAPGTKVNLTVNTDGTRQGLINAIEDALNAAGWTTLSGHHTATIVLQSGSTSTGNSICAALNEPAGANACSRISIRNASASLVSQVYYLLPTNAVGSGNEFRIVANQYQCAIFVRGVVVYTQGGAGSVNARAFVMFGVLALPSLPNGAITGDFGWIQGDAYTDAGGNSTYGTRCLRTFMDNDNHGYFSQIMNGQVANGNNTNGALNAAQRLLASQSYFKYWHDGITMVVSDPLMAFGITGAVDPGFIRGQLWDVIVLADAFPMDTVVTHDGNNWAVITNNCASGTLCLLAN